MALSSIEAPSLPSDFPLNGWSDRNNLKRYFKDHFKSCRLMCKFIKFVRKLRHHLSVYLLQMSWWNSQSDGCFAIHFVAYRRRQRQRWDKAATDVVHALPDAGTGEGIPLQPLPDAAEADRNSSQSVPVGASDQDLVPEPAHEVEEGAQDRHHEHDAASPHDDEPPPPPPPAAPPSPDHGRPDRRPQDIARRRRRSGGGRGHLRRPRPPHHALRLLSLLLNRVLYYVKHFSICSFFLTNKFDCSGRGVRAGHAHRLSIFES